MKHLITILLLLSIAKVHSFDIVGDPSLEGIFIIDPDEEGDSNLESPPKNINRYERHKRNIFESEEDAEEEEEAQTGDQISIHSYKIQSTITSRFAQTVVYSKVTNHALHAQSVVFDVQIPKAAFITNFTMDVNGITFVGSVKEKTTARNAYNQARARGKAAGMIRTNTRELESFRAEVNVPAGSKIKYELHYQEVMLRKLGAYEHVIHLQPGKLVNHFQVDVYIFEPQGIQYVEVPNLLGHQFKDFFNITHGDKKAHVSFKLPLQYQRKCENCSTTAIDGQFVVKYDTLRETNGGSLQVYKGYFVHFFAPTKLPPLPKNVIFVIDVSGSMWGLKMKQTVQAMQTILDDLRPDDYFSIIDFNHNVRCWSEELVPASSIQIADAKQYIEAIQPSGGTNINEALLRAIYILREASDLGLLDPRSVSLIFLISDGDPTVGELKLSVIQKNVKRKMREEYSLFTIGIGFDVDYDFLERIALENRGMARRIYGNQDASVQLRNFYAQVSTPLLQNIEFHYTPDVFVNVTQNSFNKFFSGSEIVVAGKIINEDLLGPVLVAATSSQMELTYDVTMEDLEQDEAWAQQKYVFKDFTKQYWAFLTINQLLVERNLAATAVAKREITKKIMDLAVQHQFVTPLTAMLVESKDTEEKLLADSPKSSKGACCPGATIVGKKNNIPPITAKPPWADLFPPTALPSEVLVSPTESFTGLSMIPDPNGIIIPETGRLLLRRPNDRAINTVENDPHFIIHLTESKEDVCFNIDSEPGKILNLISDPVMGVTVNGELISAKKHANNKLNTYFGTFGLYFSQQDLQVEISTERIIVKDGSDHSIMYWSETGSMTQKGVTISVRKNSKVKVAMNDEMAFLIQLHRVWKKHPVNVDFLGIYTPKTNKFSSAAHGLIGQFFNEPEVNVFNIRPGADPKKPIATMEAKGHKLTVTRGWQKDYWTNTVDGNEVYCWFVHNSGKGFIDGHYKDYLVSDLYSFLQHL